MKPDVDTWIRDPVVQVVHRREADVEPERLWRTAASVQVGETRRLGRLIRWRIPGVPDDISYDQMFRSAPFNVLYADDGALIAGLVGRIWTLRRDYPDVSAEEFRDWRRRGTVRVLFATWVEPTEAGGAALVSDVRVDAIDRPARLGLGALRPLINRSHNLIGSEGLELAVSRLGGDEAADG